jgi:hypothetical protein
MKSLIYAIFALVLLAACSPNAATPTPEVPPVRYPSAPQPGDSSLTRGPVYLDSTEIVAMMSFPVQFALTLQGNLPTPCHSLRVALSDPDAENRIAVEVYSLVDPQEVCVQMLEPFQATVPLGSFPAGHYIVEINGKQVAEFDA